MSWTAGRIPRRRAPRTEREYQMSVLNDFNGWVIALGVQLYPSDVIEPRAVEPVNWPPHWFEICECGRRNK